MGPGVTVFAMTPPLASCLTRLTGMLILAAFVTF
jgi:hypothetical protein